ncbi:MAG TPA: hypothetical protein VGD46_05090, partial [Rhizobacter sp.]
SPPVSAKGEFRYARVRINTTAASTVMVKTPTMRLSVKVVPIEETGKITTSSNPLTPAKVTLGREFTAVKEIVITPVNAIEPMSGVADNIDVDSGVNSSFDVYVFDRFGQMIAADVQWKFKGV